jgi:hypothetical protein
MGSPSGKSDGDTIVAKNENENMGIPFPDPGEDSPDDIGCKKHGWIFRSSGNKGNSMRKFVKNQWSALDRTESQQLIIQIK